MSIIDVELQKLNLRCVHDFYYFPGDCLFDAIAYIIQYKKSSLSIRQNVVAHMQHCLSLGTSEALLCRSRELQPAFMHNLHQGQVNSESDYLDKMALPAKDGGLWGDFTILFWISQYFQCPILVWNKRNGKVMSRLGEHFTNPTLQLLFGNDHYEPIESCITTSNDHTPNNVAKNINPMNIDIFESVEIELKKPHMKRNERDLIGI
jgi:hypothetical protein